MLREERKKHLKEEIFTKAIKLFKEKGYENVKVEDITSACGIAKGTFFNYFSKKEHILLYLGESQLDLLEKSIIKYQEIPDLKVRIEKIFGELFLRFIQQEALMKYLLVEMIKSAVFINEETRSMKVLQDSLTSLIEEAKGKKQFVSKWDADLISSSIIGVYFQTLMNWTVLPKEELDLFALFQRQFSLIWEGINCE
jgi:AcrR family transcriptional regulator